MATYIFKCSYEALEVGYATISVEADTPEEAREAILDRHFDVQEWKDASYDWITCDAENAVECEKDHFPTIEKVKK